MGSCSYSSNPKSPFRTSQITFSKHRIPQFPIKPPTRSKLPKTQSCNIIHRFSPPLLLYPSSSATQISSTLRSPRGFGAPNKVNKGKKKKKTTNEDDSKNDEDEYEEEEEEEEEEERGTQGIIPEIVTNRMMKRMAFSVGIPLSVGLAFFPFFYYLKVGLKIDVPTWVPFIVSFVFFGSALLGVSYGIVSSSWDPLREGSLLGWNEAQKNWPVFWQSLRGGDPDSGSGVRSSKK